MSDVAVINQPLRKHESKSGKVRYSISMKSEALVIGLDAATLGDQVSKAMAAELRARVEGITAEAAPATIKARESAARAVAKGEPWAVKRYSGGKIGAMPPNQSRRAFNDSGRFAKSIVAQAAPGKWRINVASNRLDPSTGSVDRIWARLTQLVPAFVDLSLLMDAPAVEQGVRRGLEAMITKARESEDRLSEQRAKNMLALIAQIVIKAAA